MNNGFMNFKDFIKPRVEGREDEKTIKKGVQHIIAEKIAKDSDTIAELKKLSERRGAYMEVTPASIKKAEPKMTKFKINQHAAAIENLVTYFQRKKFLLNDILPYHILAINRAENQKLMTVKIILPDMGIRNFMNFLERRWKRGGAVAFEFWKTIFQDSFSRLMLPYLHRDIRSQLTKVAVKTSLNVFGQNLKHLLMTPPIHGKVILGADPGFLHGCKLAVISETSEILQTGVIFLNDNVAHLKVIKYLKTYRCSTIAIGNGTACRETEAFFSDILKSPEIQHLNCTYCIVNEHGASIYSISPLAEKEMPDLDPNLRSAVSIARRLQNPMGELVKIDPKHLGIGMYQHDLSKGPLKKALDGVVEDCVSFVGVDVNSCSSELLQYVAGVGPVMAQKIIKHRVEKGCFQNRNQLMEVKGLGVKTFQQCAGFIRISHSPVEAHFITKPEDKENVLETEVIDLTVSRKRRAKSSRPSKKSKISSDVNPLDRTWIHPESYKATEKLVMLADTSTALIGSHEMQIKLPQLLNKMGPKKLAMELSIDEPTLQLIVDGLQQESNFDIRSDYSRPIFKKGLASLQDLKSGVKIMGHVTNVVGFGAFVDVGVGTDGLIHISQMGMNRPLVQGDRVEVVVMSVSYGKTSSSKVRIGVRLNKIL